MNERELYERGKYAVESLNALYEFVKLCRRDSREGIVSTNMARAADSMLNTYFKISKWHLDELLRLRKEREAKDE